MSDIRFNRWLHQSGTGGIYQDADGNIGIGTSVPRSALDVQSGFISVGENVLSASGVSTFTGISASGVSVTGVVTATSYQGDGSALTGIDATSLKDSGGNVKIQAEASGAVVTGVLTASSSIEVGETFLKEHSVGIGTTTTAGRNAGVGTDLGTMIYNVTTGAVEVYGTDGWASIGSLTETTEYFVFTSPGTANITSNNEFGPTATVDILHISPGSNGSTGQGGCGSSNNCGAGGAGGAGGALHYKVGLTVAQTGVSIPVTIPSYPTPVMPSPSPGGGPFAGGSAPSPSYGNPGNAGTSATFTITPFAPYFPAYTLTDGSGGAATPAGTDDYAGDGGSGGGGGLVVTQNGTVPTTLAPPTNSSITGTNGNPASGFGGRQPGPGGNGGTGYGAGGGGGAGGAELNGSTTGGASGGAGAPGIMIIKVTGFV